MLTLTSALLDEIPGLRHAFFTRKGGVSQGVYDSLNVGVGSRDDPEAVQENRARAAAELRVELSHLLTCYQVHSSIAVAADAPFAERPEADGVVTTVAGLASRPLDHLLPPAAPGAVVEISAAQEAFGAELGALLAREGGVALLIDYGRSEPGAGDTLQALIPPGFEEG